MEFFLTYIKMSKKSSAKHQNIKERLQKSL